ncbi:MAG TPA: hypothetical protein VFD74_05865 [Thermoleophilia bacterium]|nr:hypothetical protein [Thermoleophilia bacterium]
MTRRISVPRVFHVFALFLGALSLLGALGSALWVLVSFGPPMADDNYGPAFWAFVLVVLGVITAFSAWKRRPEPVWLAAFALLVIGIGGIWTIGFVVIAVACPVALTAFVLSCNRLLSWWLRLPIEQLHPGEGR